MKYTDMKKGELFAFSEGEYSDYQINGLFKAMADFNMITSAKEWVAKYSPFDESCPRKWQKDFEDRGGITGTINRKYEGLSFTAWLLERNLVEVVDYKEIHTGCYGDFLIEPGKEVTP